MNEMDDLLKDIAENLSILATTEDTPSYFDPASDPFEASEVNFAGNGWLLQLSQIQGWLQLDTAIDSESFEKDPLNSLHRFFGSIGVDSPENCVDSGDQGMVRLTLEGAEELTNYLESAVSLRDRFLEDLDTKDLTTATDTWSELWEEETTQRGDLGPIIASTDSWPITEFGDMAADGMLNLNPSYQRSDVWSARASQELIVSVLRGIPLPSVILLLPDSNASNAFEVVDGKQRLTALLRFMGKHPKALETVKEKAMGLDPERGKELEEAFAKDYKKFKRLWKNYYGGPTGDEIKKYFFPFPLPNSKALPEEIRKKYYSEIRDIEIQVGHRTRPILQVFERTGEGNYRIPVITYTDAAPSQIHEVFSLYNRQGKHLNAEEIRNALFHLLDIAKLLLVLSGDNNDIEDLVPFIPEEQRELVNEIGVDLTGYGFGDARYKRTKILSWLTAILMHPAIGEDGEFTIRSTAKQIDGMMEDVRDDSTHPLRNRERLKSLVIDLHSCISVHSAFSGWAPVFQDEAAGAKWQELQLMGSLVGVFLISVMSENPAETLSEHHDSIYAFTSEHRRPEKTQNRTQWGFISKVALGLVKDVGINLDELDGALKDRYTVSCIPTLQAAERYYEPRLD